MEVFRIVSICFLPTETNFFCFPEKNCLSFDLFGIGTFCFHASFLKSIYFPSSDSEDDERTFVLNCEGDELLYQENFTFVHLLADIVGCLLPLIVVGTVAELVTLY